MSQIDMLRAWDGDIKKLGNAERFLLQMLAVPRCGQEKEEKEGRG
jgi:hypothetical protein